MPSLHWIGKEKVINHHHDVPFRVLDHQYTFTANTAQINADSSNNLIIHGDNLEALKALLPQYEGRVKCIYIDPPYNTGNEGWVYNDNVNDPKIKRWLGQVVGKESEDLSRHDKWLCMMYPRLVLLQKLLSYDGSIWVSIDDNEAHFLKIIMDEIFGVNCFIADIIWKKRDGAPNDRKIGYIHEHIIVFAKSKNPGSKKTVAEDCFNLIPRSEKSNADYKVFAEPNGPDPKGAFRKIDTTANGKGGRFVESLFYPIRNPYTNEDVWPRKGTCWRHNKDEMIRLQNDNRLYWGVNGQAGTPMRKLYLFEAREGMTVPSIWNDIALNQHGAQEIEKIFGEKAHFDTPKPTDLIKQIVQIASDKNSIVLDSFAGSGTTADAVLKLNQQDGGKRQFILVEMGDYAETTTAERVRRVIQGYDKKEGTGGDFSYYIVAEKLFDERGNLNPSVDAEKIRKYIWFSETKGKTLPEQNKEPYLLGVQEGTAYYFCYDPEAAVTLNYDLLGNIKTLAEQYIIYADSCILSDEYLQQKHIIFKKIPRDITRL
ncbi:site-specific DNA-methyltransferase [Spirosoma gilvum]